jgi:hypothetical protein
MLVTNHVLSGAVIGAATHRAAPAFFLGIASHFALDAAPHWGKWTGRPHFMEVAVTDGLTGLAAMGAMTAIAPRGARLAVLAGMAGAALPDLDKPSVVFFGRSPFPRVVDAIHMRIQDEAPHRFKYELAAAAGFAAVAAALLRSRPAPQGVTPRRLRRSASAGGQPQMSSRSLLISAVKSLSKASDSFARPVLATVD